MALRKLEPGALVGDQVFDAIHDAIMSGDLPAGHRLRIRDLAAELGTSVMPVREAIRRLEENGLAEAIPYKGAVVKGFTLEELLHVYAVRRLLEVEATRLGAAAVTAPTLNDMRFEYRSMREALAEGRIADYLDHDERLLALLYASSGNPVLVEMIRTLWRRCRSYKIVGAQRAVESGDSGLLLTYQEKLLEAASAHDPDAAARISDDSVAAATERIRTTLVGSFHVS